MRTPATLLAFLMSGSCASTATRASGPPPSSRAIGSFAARIALTGRSTYAGSLDLSASSRDSVRGSLRLTSPIAVDAAVSGIVRHDSLLLSGSYHGSNGCMGDLRAALDMPTDRAATGPFELADKCAGTLTGTMTVTR